MFKKGILTVLVVALSFFGFGLAHADQIDSLGSISGPTPTTNVYVNPGGLGDALIYGYYNVRDNRENYFTVINTDASNGVRARIRFREASNVGSDCNGSADVLDFDICLSPGDVWSGAIVNVGGTATLFSDDDDTYIDIACARDTSPHQTFAGGFPSGVEFKYAAAGVTQDQTLEGYFVVIAANQLSETATIYTNCGADLWDDETAQVDNVLMGHNYAVDMDNLETYAYNATALADFSSMPLLYCPTAANPDFTDAFPDGLTGVNYALTKSNLYTAYTLDALIAGKTETIVTFPTKLLTHTCSPLTDDIFDDPRVLITVWDDEEHSPISVCEFSPCPPGTDTSLPYEVNVIDWSDSDIFTSTVEVAIAVTFDFGWLNIDLVNAATSAPSPAHVTCFGVLCSYGLPAIGYTAIDVSLSDSTHMLPLQYSSDVQ